MSQIHIPADSAEFASNYAFQNYAPKIGAAAMQFSHAVYEHTQLSVREMEGARYITALINGCSVCSMARAARDFNTKMPTSDTLLERPMDSRGELPTEDYYQAVTHWQTSTIFSARERLAIEFAERMGERPKSFEGDETFWEQMHANFSNDEIVDLTLSVGSWMAMGRAGHILELDAICALPTARAA